MTEKEKKLANEILNREFDPLTVVRLYVDHVQSGSIVDSDSSHIRKIYTEFEKSVLKNGHQTMFSYHIECILRSFFWTQCSPSIETWYKKCLGMILVYPKYYEDEWIEDYGTWTFNIADTMLEAHSINYGWLDDEEEEEVA